MIQFASVNKTVSGLERGGDGGGMIVDDRSMTVAYQEKIAKGRRSTSVANAATAKTSKVHQLTYKAAGKKKN